MVARCAFFLQYLTLKLGQNISLQKYKFSIIKTVSSFITNKKTPSLCNYEIPKL